MNYYFIEPDVAGRVQEGRKIYENRKSIDSIDFVFDYWPNDIVESTPVFLISERLSNRLLDNEMTGFLLKSCNCTKGDQFDISCPGGVDIPPYFWLDVNGIAGVDDFGIEDLNLVISQRVFDILGEFDISLAEINPY